MANAAETYINCDGDTNPHLSLHFSSFSDGLLKNFIAGTKFPPKLADAVTSEEDEGVELSLGLSLNGRFGSDPTRDNNLARSSSIPESLKPSSSKDEGASVSVTWTPPILRTSSLPMEVQEECRKRKQMQSLRRMEAKRKRTEKQRNMMNKKVDHHSKIMGNSESDNVLVASQGSGSSGISEFDSQSIQANEYAEEGSPQLDKPKPKPKPKPKQTINGVSTDDKSSMRKVLLEMPCVSTTGEGPNGRRIEGFLYRYRKGEEVKIVCVCHGSFLTPAEFVKHAGGADVLHPLKHIVVTPSPFAS